jgi:hypothetical protein
MQFREIIVLRSENHIKTHNILCAESAVFFNGKAGGTFSNHCALMGSNNFIQPRMQLKAYINVSYLAKVSP